MEKAKEKTLVNILLDGLKRLTIGDVLSWLIGIFSIIGAFFFILKYSIIAILQIIGGLFLLPLSAQIIKKNSNINIKGWHRATVYIILTIIVKIIFGTNGIDFSNLLGIFPGIFGLFIYVAIFILYFWPSILAYRFNHKKNADAIFLLNLFLGWTFIGWIIALIWSTTKD